MCVCVCVCVCICVCSICFGTATVYNYYVGAVYSVVCVDEPANVSLKQQCLEITIY